MEFDQIYEAYFSDVYAYIYRLSGDRYLAEEVTSETFFKAMQSIRNFRGECDLRVWLCQIAKNCYYSHLQKRRRWVRLEEAGPREPENPAELPDDWLVRKEEVRRIKRQLQTLPEPYKEVFMWRVFAELSFKQIGQIFNKSDNWACVTYHRARIMLKGRMEESDHGK